VTFRSISRRAAPTEVIVEAGADDVGCKSHVLTDAHSAKRGKRIAEDDLIAEVDIQIFGFHRPLRRELGFDAAAERPTRYGKRARSDRAGGERRTLGPVERACEEREIVSNPELSPSPKNCRKK